MLITKWKYHNNPDQVLFPNLDEMIISTEPELFFSNVWIIEYRVDRVVTCGQGRVRVLGAAILSQIPAGQPQSCYFSFHLILNLNCKITVLISV